jgi:hypothetical protein
MYGLGEPLDRLLAKVERAKKHIVDLEAERDQFYLSNPVRFRAENDQKTGEHNWYVAEIKPIPLSFAVIIGDAANNLRSALDHMAYNLVCVGEGAVKTFQHAKFPVGSDLADYKNQRTKALKGMRPDAIAAIDALQPYVGGAGEYFWHLARINNHDKHKLLLTSWSSFDGHTAFKSEREWIAKFHGGGSDQYRSAFIAPAMRIFPLKLGDRVLTASESDIDETMSFLVGIAFVEPEIVKGNPVIDTLHEMTKLVRATIFDFDRQGLFR